MVKRTITLFFACFVSCPAENIVLAQSHKKKDVMLNVGPGPGLLDTSISGPANAYLKQVVSVTYQVENQGVADAGAFTVGLHPSADELINWTDLLLKKVTFRDGLATSQSTGATTKVNIPINPAFRDYHLGAIADLVRLVARVTNRITLDGRQRRSRWL